MTDHNYRHYVLIVDRSGSMTEIRDEAQQGIRFFVAGQAKLPGRATISLYQFDGQHEQVHDFASLSEAAGYELVPRGSTALLDACGFAIAREGEKLAVLPEDQRPDKIIVLITTDGKENMSHEYTKAQVNGLITQQREKYGWEFSYVGANQDSFAEAGAIGIPGAATLNYSASGAGTRSAYAAASAASVRFASGQSVNTRFTDDERKAAEEK